MFPTDPFRVIFSHSSDHHSSPTCLSVLPFIQYSLPLAIYSSSHPTISPSFQWPLHNYIYLAIIFTILHSLNIIFLTIHQSIFLPKPTTPIHQPPPMHPSTHPTCLLLRQALATKPHKHALPSCLHNLLLHIYLPTHPCMSIFMDGSSLGFKTLS